MNVLGIDPGYDGGFAIYSDGELVGTWQMPTITVTQKKTRKIKANEKNPDGKKTKTYAAKVRHLDFSELNKLFHMFRTEVYDVDKIFLEQVSARPDEGVASVFRFGIAYGSMLTMVACSGLPYELVTPGVWTKAVCGGISAQIEQKDRAKLAAKRLFPRFDFVLKGCRKEHTGLVDAALIAYYGYVKECRGE